MAKRIVLFLVTNLAIITTLSIVLSVLGVSGYITPAGGLDFIALGKLFEDLGRWEEAARLFERGLQSGVTEADFALAVKRLSILQKRRGDFNEAIRLWEEAAANGHIYAHIEIAKYYEHKCRDVKTAIQWTRSALDHLEHTDLPAYMRKHWLEEINHRLERLERKNSLRRPA